MLQESLNPKEGDLTPLFADTNNTVWIEKEEYGGAYPMSFGFVEEPSENGRDPQLVNQLWVASRC
jgi:hypothetical protein